MKLMLDTRELAEAIGYSVDTVRAYTTKEPGKLPPRANLPVRKCLWRVSDVEKWLDERGTMTVDLV